MTRKLTIKQKGFADDLLKTGNKRQSAKNNYNIGGKGGSKTKEQEETIADSIAQETCNKLAVKAYLQDKAERASEVIFELCNKSKNDNVRLGAGRDILDRAGYKPVEESKINLKTTISLTDIINKADE